VQKDSNADRYAFGSSVPVVRKVLLVLLRPGTPTRATSISVLPINTLLKIAARVV
jgi:hypothetical protein